MPADEPHRRDLDQHLDGEEGEDGVVERFEDAAARDEARYVRARLEHAERHAVEQDHTDADPLEPRSHGQGTTHGRSQRQRRLAMF